MLENIILSLPRDCYLEIIESACYIGEKLIQSKKFCKTFLINLIEKIQTFIENNCSTIFFVLCSAFVIKYAFLRVFFSAMITLVFINNFEISKQPSVISSTDRILNIIGATGLLLHRLFYPLSNPLFYFAPILSGVALSKSAYSLYRDD
jgi:hypothetical protein